MSKTIKNKIELTTDANGNIILAKPTNATAEEIRQAKAAYFAKAKTFAATRAQAAAAFDAEFLAVSK